MSLSATNSLDNNSFKRYFMKKTFIIALSIIFAVSGVLAQKTKPVPKEETQEKTITDTEFQAVRRKSDNLTQGENYRLKRTTKVYKRADNSLVRYHNETIEFLLPGSSRSVVENASGNEKPTITETIRIDANFYTRINNGNWQLVSSNINVPKVSYTGDTIEHIYKGEVKLGNNQFTLYESKYTSKTVKGGRDFVTVIKVKNYFNADGTLVRTEDETETPNTITRRTFEYEYKVNLTIEAPIK